MCGIFAYLKKATDVKSNNVLPDKSDIEKGLSNGKNRGPEESKIYENDDIFLGFHRLAINGLDKESSQPLSHNNIKLVCNGEIYNYKQLSEKLKYDVSGFNLNTNSDCEIILHLYEKFGIKTTLKLLDGVFGFVLYDYRDESNIKVFAARDPYGVRPLYKLKLNQSVIGFSSVMKMLSPLMKNSNYNLTQFTPGTYTEMNFSTKYNKWFYCNNTKYINMPISRELPSEFYNADDKIKFIEKLQNESLEGIRNSFINGVKKRVENTDRPIACLLSGGLDSSIVTSIVNKFYKQKGIGKLETYSIGIKGGEDLKYAKIVAEFLDTKHTEIELTERDFLDAIPEVVNAIESYDTTTVRASVGNYLIAKYISNNSKAKVIFNGDGSDELMGGYLYFHNTPNSIEFDNESRRLLENIHYFDGLRSDRSISCHGLEPRTPFLDRFWVQHYLSLPLEVRHHSYTKKCEKYLFRLAFDVKNSNGIPEYLPNEILWRTKEAFSDGVSKQTRSWYEIINEFVTTKIDKEIQNKLNNMEQKKHNNPETLEQKYYRYLYLEKFRGCDTAIPYFWMPKYSNATDSSARTLKIYNNVMK